MLSRPWPRCHSSRPTLQAGPLHLQLHRRCRTLLAAFTRSAVRRVAAAPASAHGIAVRRATASTLWPPRPSPHPCPPPPPAPAFPSGGSGDQISLDHMEEEDEVRRPGLARWSG
ncbi:hypothetical protein U9M48_000500 [Paspalum notatum var. saurae]|uniref:Uncharacterized protein n=1 Tax=Paspalum notatum var. saurae TaxID=547442 RepID=A0AAQ3PI66_PASNO